jgi:hypothetical protein
VLGHKRFEEIQVKPIRDWQDALKEAFSEGVFNA